MRPGMCASRAAKQRDGDERSIGMAKWLVSRNDADHGGWERGRAGW